MGDGHAAGLREGALPGSITPPAGRRRCDPGLPRAPDSHPRLRPYFHSKHCPVPAFQEGRWRILRGEMRDETGWCREPGQRRTCPTTHGGDPDAASWGSPRPDWTSPQAPGHRHDGILRQSRRQFAERHRPAMAGGAVMKDAVAAYLVLRRAAGFEMANAEYLLGSFARFATERNETH